jgi:hypothetical protein
MLGISKSKLETAVLSGNMLHKQDASDEQFTLTLKITCGVTNDVTCNLTVGHPVLFLVNNYVIIRHRKAEHILCNTLKEYIKCLSF